MNAPQFALRRPRYADVVATLALFIAMGGSAYAVSSNVADPNSVDTAAIQNHAVTTPKLADEAVGTDEIAPDAVTGGKIAPAAVTGTGLAPNSVTSVAVAPHSLSVADLQGTSTAAKLRVAIRARSCVPVKFTVAGATAGSAAFLSYRPGFKIPRSLVISPLSVASAGVASASACNLAGRRLSVKNLGVRIITLR